MSQPAGTIPSPLHNPFPPPSPPPQTNRKIGNNTYPACLANCAAALLLTPALQKNTTSFSKPGFCHPKRSSKSSALSMSASGCDEMGMLSAVGMLLALNSEGSRTSMRSVVEDGFETRERTWWRGCVVSWGVGRLEGGLRETYVFVLVRFTPLVRWEGRCAIPPPRLLHGTGVTSCASRVQTPRLLQYSCVRALRSQPGGCGSVN